MGSFLNVAMPIFVLIGIGYLCRRCDVLPKTSSSELSRFVVYLALPALLFDATAHLNPADFGNINYIVVFAAGMGCAVLLTLCIRLVQKVRLVDATIDGLGAGYANVGFMGIPLCLLAFGRESLVPAVIATVMTACVLFAISIVVIETSMHADTSPAQTLVKVSRSLLRNPLVLAPLFGTLCAVSDITVPGSIEQVFKLLGAAAGPCALVSLGLFLAQPIPKAASEPRGVWLIVMMKLFGQPVVTAVLAYWVFRLPQMWADTAVLLSALPIGTGPFMLAERYGREASAVSRAILLSTAGSLVSVSVILAWISHRAAL